MREALRHAAKSDKVTIVTINLVPYTSSVVKIHLTRYWAEGVTTAN